MQILESLSLQNYKMKDASLRDLRDLNIIIGPNNSGKTSLLKAIYILSRFQHIGDTFTCGSCRSHAEKHGFQGFDLSLEKRERFKDRGKVKLTFKFNKEILAEKIGLDATNYLKQQEDFAHDFALTLGRSPSTFESEHPIGDLTLETRDSTLRSQHMHFFIKKDSASKIIDSIFSKILMCPEERLQIYKTKNLDQFLKEKDMDATTITKLKNQINRIVDSRISRMRTSTMSLVLDVDNEDFIATIAEQGTGIKSLICLIADILTSPDSLMLLIDEPELGLNPSGKKAFLEFLLDQTFDKQVFITTHDPTFLNPVIWKRSHLGHGIIDPSIAVYLYSEAKQGFVAVAPDFNKEDPSCFAGFLPHTTSMKEYQIYVEGMSDVYVFEVFLEKYLNKEFEKHDARTREYDRYVLKNKVGIFHLGGDQWEHFIATVPSSPIKSLVILDGDKEPIVTAKLQKRELPSRFKLFTYSGLSALITRAYELQEEIEYGRVFSFSESPIYCLQKKKIEKYLRPKPKTKMQNVEVALEMKEIPQEIEELFSAFFSERAKP